MAKFNGEEASAHYAAGTAQYHINAAVTYAIERNVRATSDVDFLFKEGVEVLAETARLWHDLGFVSRDGAVHIHRVTGPDEYTTVVNDNLYTNVMARFNLRLAAQTMRALAEHHPEGFDIISRRIGLTLDEAEAWDHTADLMFLPYDESLGIHPQDDSFLNLEPWDFDGTPDDKYPLLLNFHPLVIYRHQVLKQADVVLALYLRGEHFDLDQKRRNFDYYDPITTGDSSLSACVQSIVASEVGYRDVAWRYFQQSLFLDLTNSLGNTADGVHIANAGGVWSALLHGFGGVRFTDDAIAIDPALPDAWNQLLVRFIHRGSQCSLRIDADGWTLSVDDGPGVFVRSARGTFAVNAGATHRESL